MELSVVIPVHNEAEHLDAFLTGFLQRVETAGPTSLTEVLLVENGSRDATLEVCRRWEAQRPGLVKVLVAERASYGAAVRQGLLAATGTHVSVLECDALDAEFLVASERLVHDQGARIIVASKQHPESRDGRPLKRRMITRVFNWVLRITTGYPGTDTHGLKTLEAGLARRLCGLAVTSDEVFQTEIVLLAWRLGESVHELPLQIEEHRAPPISIRRRSVPALGIVRDLRRSLGRPEIPPPPSTGALRLPAGMAWALAILLLAFVASMYWLSQGARELLPDEGVYSYVGWAWAHGDVLYRDAWDHKGPVAYVVPGLRALLLGHRPELVAIQELVLGVLGAAGLGWVAWQWWGAVAAAGATLLGVLLWAQFPPGAGLTSTTGSVLGVLIPFAVGSLVAATRAPRFGTALRWLFLFGALQALAFWTKPNAIATLALLPLVALVPALRPRRRLAMATGAAVLGALSGGLLVVLPMFLQGSVDAMLDAVFRFNASRGAAAISGFGLVDIVTRMGRILYEHGYLLPLVVVAGFTALEWWRWVTIGLPLQRRIAAAVIPGWIVLEAVAFASNAAYTHHTYPLLPALALGSIWVLEGAWSRRCGRPGWTALFAALFVLAFGRPLWNAVRLPVGDPAPSDWRRVASVLAERTHPDERVLSITGWVGPGMLYAAGRLSAVTWTTPIGLYMPGYASDSQWARIAERLEAEPTVRVAIADVMGLLPAPDPPTVAWAIQHLDAPLLREMFIADAPFPSRDRVRRILLGEFAVTHCDAAVCLLERQARPAATAP